MHVLFTCCTPACRPFLQGWEELEDIIISGFVNLMLAAGGSGGNVGGALREHDRCGRHLFCVAAHSRLHVVQLTQGHM